MLRILWGESAQEKLQREEILRLRAQLSDLQAAYQTQAISHEQRIHDAYKGMFSFLRPASVEPDMAARAPESRHWPGDRPDTSPPYPDKPLWAKTEIKTAGDS